MSTSRMLVNDYAGVAVVTFTDNAILEAATIDAIGRELYHLVDGKAKQRIVLDFTRVKTMSSQGLGILINLKKKLGAIKGEMALCGMRPEIKKLFAITGLEKDFKFHPDDKSALGAWKINVT